MCFLYSFTGLSTLNIAKMIPGSHLWDNQRPPSIEEVDYATMQKGDAYVMLGSTYHAGGANQTSNEKRPMHGLFFCRGYYRQEVSFSLVKPFFSWD